MEEEKINILFYSILFYRYMTEHWDISHQRCKPLFSNSDLAPDPFKILNTIQCDKIALFSFNSVL